MENAKYYEMTRSYFCSPCNFAGVINYKSRRVTHLTRSENEKYVHNFGGEISGEETT